MLISLFENDQDTNPQVRELLPEQFLAAMREPLPKTVPKKSLPMWSAAEMYGGKKLEHVFRVWLLVYDVDEEPVPSLVEIRKALTGIQSFIHSSSSHSPEKPRWRVGIFLDRPVTVEEYPRLWSAVASRLPFPVGQQSKNANRCWYFPRVPFEGEFIYG